MSTIILHAYHPQGVLFEDTDKKILNVIPSLAVEHQRDVSLNIRLQNEKQEYDSYILKTTCHFPFYQCRLFRARNDRLDGSTLLMHHHIGDCSGIEILF